MVSNSSPPSSITRNVSTKLVLSMSCAIREWELAGLSLSNALEKYLDLSEHLGTKALRENTRPQHLAARIDSILESLHTALGRKLSLIHSVLARTRNQLAPLIYCLPREILTEIFMNVIYSPIDQHTTSMQTAILHMFRNLYSLQFVCRMWRDIILSQGSFWRFAPIYCMGIPELRCTQAANLTLERSQGDLYLAALMQIVPSRVFCSLPFSSRFRKINISSEFNSMIRDFLEKLLEHDPPFNLSELSLHESDNYPSREEDVITILWQGSTYWDSFCELIKSLSVFRVRGAHFDWDHMEFSSNLVEIHIQDVMMGSDTAEFVGFLRKLSSASNLRDMKLISVQSSFDLDSLAPPENRIHFPRLESLLLEDLPCNTLITAIYHISPGSHRLTLYLTDQCTKLVGHEQEAHSDSLFSSLSAAPVDTLVLSGEWEWGQEWLPVFDLHSLLCSQPEIKSLKLSSWSLTEQVCRTIAQTQITTTTGTERKLFPNLEYLDLSSVQIWDEGSLKHIVTSHRIKRMALGGFIRKGTDEPPQFRPIRGNEPIVRWLRRNVPDFTLTSENALPAEYSSSVWQLW